MPTAHRTGAKLEPETDPHCVVVECTHQLQRRCVQSVRTLVMHRWCELPIKTTLQSPGVELEAEYGPKHLFFVLHETFIDRFCQRAGSTVHKTSTK